MPTICTEIDEWIVEDIVKEVEIWEERQEKKCKEYAWYDPRGWFCWIVTIFVKVVRTIVEKVGRWITRTVCKVVTAVVEVLIDISKGALDVILGIFTLDWRRVLDGIIKIGIGVINYFVTIFRIGFLGDTIDFIISEINKNELREYVKKLLEEKYEGENLENIKRALRVDHGVFGMRIKMKAIRTYLDSETLSIEEPNIPNLVKLHESGDINLKELSGFEFNEGVWNRKRYKTLKKDNNVSGGGGGEFDNPISESELEKYISTRGLEGPKFTILCMRDQVLQTKLDAASEKGREIGLIPNWITENIEVTDKDHITHKGFNTGAASSALVDFLIKKIGRADINLNTALAQDELCKPIAIGVFKYTDGLRGISACLMGSSCGQPSHDTSGATFIDNKPDTVWKYVPIHEIGHYFGLCHVNGIDRIMYSSREGSMITWSTFLNLLYLKGDPSFTLDEAKQVWDYIIEHFPVKCLGGNP